MDGNPGMTNKVQRLFSNYNAQVSVGEAMKANWCEANLMWDAELLDCS